ncbi:MAG: ATP-binding cassette domain-containing protein [Candidatus Thermoplasmatota archaeon]|nr:ATP-binding cassette domain-containing protein [Candidatus Thermoplasmatota archaeon]
MSNSISAENLEIGYSEILAKISEFNVEEGEIVSIIGKSGIGKTTFLKTIANLINPIEGNLAIFGSERKKERGLIGYIPQKLGLVNHGSVFANVLQGAVCQEPVWRSITGFHEQGTLEKVQESIEIMGLNEKIDEPISKLSGGQQRRVAIARTIAQNPKIILADEFLSELDAETAENVWKNMLNYVKEKNITLVIVEHNINWAKLADRCFEMKSKENKSFSHLNEVRA